KVAWAGFSALTRAVRPAPEPFGRVSVQDRGPAPSASGATVMDSAGSGFHDAKYLFVWSGGLFGRPGSVMTLARPFITSWVVSEPEPLISRQSAVAPSPAGGLIGSAAAGAPTSATTVRTPSATPRVLPKVLTFMRSPFLRENGTSAHVPC